MTGIVVQTLSEQIYMIIRNRIVSGELAGNDPIRQDAMAQELGVSKIPLREAFARLERDGLLKAITNRGFFVPPLHTSEMEEVYALRLKLEPEAAARACKFATDQDKQNAENLLHRQEEYASPDKAELVSFNQQFHMTLVRPLHQPITMQFLERISAVAGRYVCRLLETSGRRARAKVAHRALLDAWSAGESEQVEGLLHEHILTTLNSLRTQLPLHPEAEIEPDPVAGETGF